MIWLIGIGGALGSALRYLLGNYMKSRFHQIVFFPLGTWVINMTGSFILGILIKLHMEDIINDGMWFLIGVGFCGAYTTFSTFGYETLTLIRVKKIHLALVYVIVSILAGVLAAGTGYGLINFVI
ncbi:fluoride efflux transporter CrcB [Bacillus tuaregi]|uniref:fluoride efflux transporter CrcB n=1 Tax=Bacillus tuaregi TaxID=1816695 RepID=UPI0008F9699B|nr:fluoride efflux transporter CrcB [Bacillus tuaregi]